MKINKSYVKELFKNRKFKSGSYSAGITVIALALVIIVNMLANALPATVAKFDLSYNKMYSITPITEEFLKTLDQDITIYVLAEIGTGDSAVMEMLDKYKALSNHITVENVDPILHPGFVSQYTSENVTNGSLIVESDKRSKVIDLSDVYQTTINYTTYQSEVSAFDGEGLLTSAIHYVTTDDMPIMYRLEGHGEQTISNSLSSLIGKANIEVESLNLYTIQEVPEDAGSLLIYSPQTDISETEAEKILTYLENGGTALILADYIGEDMPNLNSILEYYGVSFVKGMVLEGNANNFFFPYPHYLSPNKSVHTITNPIINRGSFILMPLAQGIKILDSVRSTVKVEPLLTTSEEAFLRLGEDLSNSSTTMQEGDVEGPFVLGAAISEAHGNVETKLVVYSSGYIMDESTDSQVNGGNYDLVMNSMNWLSTEDSSIAIDAKGFEMEMLQITSSDVNKWSIVIVVLVPTATLITGFVVWIRRRKK